MIARNEVDKLREDIQFELQFDAVHKSLDALLIELEVLILQDYEYNLSMR